MCNSGLSLCMALTVNWVNGPQFLTVIPTKIHMFSWNYFPNESRYCAYQLHLSDV